jgi:hypothetical protein
MGTLQEFEVAARVSNCGSAPATLQDTNTVKGNRAQLDEKPVRDFIT